MVKVEDNAEVCFHLALCWKDEENCFKLFHCTNNTHTHTKYIKLKHKLLVM